MREPIEVEILDRDDICEHGLPMNEFCVACQRRIFYAKQELKRNPTGQSWLKEILDQVKEDVRKERRQS